MKQTLLPKFILAVFFAVGIGHTALSSADSLPTGFDQSSKFAINYDDWNLILEASVLDVGPSDRQPASRTGLKTTSSKIRHGNASPTAFEGNRVIFHEFKQDHRDSLLAIRKDLEAIPDFMPLENFSKNEQLAYWLNLHNVAVMLEVAEEYPIKNIKRLASGRKGIWDKQTMSIGGVPTSIRDIEKHVVTNWNHPLVLYGFFMGTIGGPNIQGEAFTGENVVEALQKNAVRFVNSLRGFRLWGGSGRVSDHYELGEHFFPDFAEDIKQHLLTYARPDTRRDIEKAKSFKIDNYDWGIADLKNGDTFLGGSFNTNPGALGFFVFGSQDSGSGGGGGLFAPPTSSALSDSFVNDPKFNKGSSGKISPQTYALLKAVQERNQRRQRQGTVTVEEFMDGDGGRIVLKDDEEDSDESNQEENNQIV